MQSRRWGWTYTYAVPLFVTSLVAVVVTGSALAAVLVMGRDGGGGAGDGEADCLVGRWRIVYQTQGSALGLGDASLDLVGEGPLFEFRADGSGHAEYGDPTRYETTSLGETVTVKVTGELTFRYHTAGDTFRLSEVESDATAEFPVIGTLPFDLDQDPVTYTCDGDTATFRNPDNAYEARYERVG